MRGCNPEREQDSPLLVGDPTVNIGCDRSTVMQSSWIRVLILGARLLEMIISIAFIGLGLFMWSSMGRSNSDVSLFAGAALLVSDKNTNSWFREIL